MSLSTTNDEFIMNTHKNTTKHTSNRVASMAGYLLSKSDVPKSIKSIAGSALAQARRKKSTEV